VDALNRALNHVPNWDTALDWLLRGGLRILLISVLASVGLRAVRAGIRRLEHHLSDAQGTDTLEQSKRARTLGDLLRNVATMAIIAIATLMILRELNVDIMPILTGAGIVGLAIGFGAQTLVKDVISGFFLILENQVRVGDVAEINGTGGLVEAINLRTIVLRDMRGAVHVFPCGGVTTLANLTKDFSYAVLDVGVAYKEDVDRVMAVLREVGAEIEAEPALRPLVLAPLEVLGIDSFADSAVVVKVRMKTAPIQQWAVARELRRRIKQAFDTRGIEIPFPHLSLYFGEASKPFVVESKTQDQDRSEPM